ncbi:MAG TPA: 1-(5-phosphoribosyl)-5-[(5-phosphoribosylamino)methylideneamino] imidazole-4-carboxamide isomerase [Candidatus Acidoferrum sp.]|nr:1-(5-phosphoribosyl)-5-[(5-phosphoribosylamino)methylideneamino] imidazole-4-carboxamide isomerase [Candidatus Acidoferrum sp.]
MLIPCIDLQDGQAVQLVHGRRRELAVADVFGLLEKFRNYKWLHIIDLDAAMNKAPNTKLVRALCTKAAREYKLEVRVGGGIRTLARATSAINAGATQIIVGSSAFKNGGINDEFLATLTKNFGRKKIVVALDTAKGQILTQGWREKLKLHPSAVIPALEPYCSTFLCTDVDREGTMTGANLRYFRELRAATKLPIIAAGGITTHREITALAKINMDAAVGMALYKDRIR